MEYNTITLPNGLRVIHLHSQSPVVYCGYEVCAGTRDERNGEEGIAHFCEHVTFKGTEHRTAMQILNRLESVGGELNAFTNKEDTVYYSAILKEHFPRAVDLLTDIVFFSTYPQHEINKEVEVICDEIESYNDSPAELIYDDFESAVFAGHPLGHNILGSEEMLKGYTTEDALRFTRRYYRPENTVFFVSGDVDFKRVVALVKKATASFPEAQPLIDVTPAAVLPDYEPQTIRHDRGTHQAHVMVGNRAYSVHDKRRMPLYLLNNILGGPGMNARLNISLRERNALVYTVESSMVCYSDTGLWTTYFGCDPKDVDKCLRFVRRELDKVMQRPLSANQLRMAKHQIKGQIGVACDNRESFALDFGKTFLHYGWKKNVESLMEDIDRITAEEIQQVAQEIFAEDRLTTLIYE
ncbi:pitrilysin family protein [uncultured Prevotella sp.]|uniref:M16 family metallopeptidase n=1 Tax=uncultured Prevotella sp. TaxID=159272 RepID=UPI00260F6387|nr:pitrilysin family protein [uncultured Prevotella sp.]